MFETTSIKAAQAGSRDQGVLRTGLRRGTVIGICIGVAALVPTAAAAKCVDIYVSKPTKSGKVEVIYDPTPKKSGDELTTKVDISASDSAEKKRNKIYEALKKDYQSDGDETEAVTKISGSKNSVGVRLCRLADDGEVKFNAATTGEKDEVLSKRASYAAISFDEQYGSLDPNGQPATITAGIVTDLGRIESEVRLGTRDSLGARELDGAPGAEGVSGQVVAELLVESMQAGANLLGAALTLGDGQILVEFDFDVADEGAGIIFQSTSDIGSIGGTLQAGEDPADSFEFVKDFGTARTDFQVQPFTPSFEDTGTLELQPGVGAIQRNHPALNDGVGLEE